MKNKLFGSKLNTVLLLILIILMVIAIYVMFQNKEVYFSVFQQQAPIATKQIAKANNLDELDTKTNYGVTVSYPKNLEYITIDLSDMKTIVLINKERGVLEIDQYSGQKSFEPVFKERTSGTLIDDNYSIDGLPAKIYQSTETRQPNLDKNVYTYIVVPSKFMIIFKPSPSYAFVSQQEIDQIFSSIKFN